jgi:hypothetical protein
VSFNECSYKQTRVMRDAVEMAVRLVHDGEQRRDEIARAIYSIAEHEKHDACALSNLAIAAATEADRKMA